MIIVETRQFDNPHGYNCEHTSCCQKSASVEFLFDNGGVARIFCSMHAKAIIEKQKERLSKITEEQVKAVVELLHAHRLAICQSDLGSDENQWESLYDNEIMNILFSKGQD
jgi:hypothetical protein